MCVAALDACSVCLPLVCLSVSPGKTRSRANPPRQRAKIKSSMPKPTSSAVLKEILWKERLVTKSLPAPESFWASVSGALLIQAAYQRRERLLRGACVPCERTEPGRITAIIFRRLPYASGNVPRAPGVTTRKKCRPVPWSSSRDVPFLLQELDGQPGEISYRCNSVRASPGRHRLIRQVPATSRPQAQHVVGHPCVSQWIAL